ncbi:MAG: hypothetical protein U1A16_01420 [Patescibacteria group bacterium]|nr:hypothetical protein [Patescibacteria group bacterium]
MNKPPLHILFVIRSAEFFFYYKSIVRALIGRGHRVRALFDRAKSAPAEIESVEMFRRDVPAFVYGFFALRRNIWSPLLFYTRVLLNYRLYITKMPEQSFYYRERAQQYFPFWFNWLLRWKPFRALIKSERFKSWLQRIERRAPPPRHVLEQLGDLHPDVIVVSSPNLPSISGEPEYLKAARVLGIPSVLPVMTWDNLTTKGFTHVMPDLFLVWSTMHADEAEYYHEVPRARVRVVGAPVFDAMLSCKEPGATREEFAARYGLRPEDPVVLYLGSSANIARHEDGVIAALRAALDSAPDRRLGRTQILLRPHPKNMKRYGTFSVPGVRTILRAPRFPDRPEEMQEFYDMCYYAVAAVGLNTSGMIDALLADKPVIAVMAEEYRVTQEQTKHFQHMLEGGALELATSPEEFCTIVARLLDGRDEKRENRAAFIKRFIRPRGRDTEVGEVVAQEIEDLVRKS